MYLSTPDTSTITPATYEAILDRVQQDFQHFMWHTLPACHCAIHIKEKDESYRTVWAPWTEAWIQGSHFEQIMNSAFPYCPKNVVELGEKSVSWEAKALDAAWQYWEHEVEEWRNRTLELDEEARECRAESEKLRRLKDCVGGLRREEFNKPDFYLKFVQDTGLWFSQS